MVYLGEAEVPSINATLLLNGIPVTLLGTHPLPPGSAEYARLRNDQLRAIATKVQASKGLTIVLGDLNATPWWPAYLPIGRIPLDHCLVSPSIYVINKQLGPNVGSDHLPVVIDLEIPTLNGSKG